jgi:hypothetical protein
VIAPNRLATITVKKLSFKEKLGDKDVVLPRRLRTFTIKEAASLAAKPYPFLYNPVPKWTVDANDNRKSKMMMAHQKNPLLRVLMASMVLHGPLCLLPVLMGKCETKISQRQFEMHLNILISLQ